MGTRRDDLESLVYILSYFVTGKLPWIDGDSFIFSKHDTFKLIKQIRKDLRLEQIQTVMPQEFQKAYQRIWKLKFEEEPVYYKLQADVRFTFIRGAIKARILEIKAKERVARMYQPVAAQTVEISSPEKRSISNPVNRRLKSGTDFKRATSTAQTSLVGNQPRQEATPDSLLEPSHRSAITFAKETEEEKYEGDSPGARRAAKQGEETFSPEIRVTPLVNRLNEAKRIALPEEEPECLEEEEKSVCNLQTEAAREHGFHTDPLSLSEKLGRYQLTANDNYSRLKSRRRDENCVRSEQLESEKLL